MEIIKTNLEFKEMNTRKVTNRIILHHAEATNCTAEDHAKIYRLVRPFDDELIGMFVPFGRVAPELGKKLLKEIVVLDSRSNVPILSIQPFSQDGYEYAVKVKTMNVADHEELQRMAGYQIRKFNACRKCLKCES